MLTSRIGHILLVLSVLLLVWRPAHAAEIEHASASITTNQTTSASTFIDIPGATLSSGNFTTGRKYLVLAHAQMGASASDVTQVQVVHGSTAFPGMDSWNPFGNSSARNQYACHTVWEAVSSEGIALQYRTRLGGAQVASADFAQLFVMNLSDDLAENTDWFSSEVSADDTMSTSYEDGASVTVGAGTWLVLSCAYVDFAAQNTNSVAVRLTDGTIVLPEAEIDIGDSGRDEITMSLSRIFETAGSTTLKVQYKVSASTTATHLHSRIFALNLDKFRNHAVAYTESGTALSATDWATQIQTISITPDVQSDVLIGSYFSFDRNDSGNMANQRIQVDGSDSPAGQTAAVYDFRHGTNPLEDPMSMSAFVSGMTASAHTIDLDGSVNTTTGTPTAKYATLWAFTMELAAAGAPDVSFMRRRLNW